MGLGDRMRTSFARRNFAIQEYENKVETPDWERPAVSRDSARPQSVLPNDAPGQENLKDSPDGQEGHDRVIPPDNPRLRWDSLSEMRASSPAEQELQPDESIGYDTPGPTPAYDPLEGPQIRLLRFERHERAFTDTGELEGSLRIFDLDRRPTYRALSYTWGDATGSKMITINGRGFTVRRGLYHFLEVFCAKHIGEWIWVDQICIDQSSIVERNHQVPLMEKIYRDATEVVIWLGAEHSPRLDDDHFMSVAKQVESFLGRYAEKGQQLSGRELSTISFMLSKEYWRRIWIMQEILLARALTIWWGEAQIPWQHFCQHVDKMSPPRSPLRLFTTHALDFRPMQPLDLVKALLKANCHDPRDLCYGIQGLLVEDLKIEIDYAKSKEDVFIDMAVAMFRSTSDRAIVNATRSLGFVMGVYQRHHRDSLESVREEYCEQWPRWSEAKLRDRISRALRGNL